MRANLKRKEPKINIIVQIQNKVSHQWHRNKTLNVCDNESFHSSSKFHRPRQSALSNDQKRTSCLPKGFVETEVRELLLFIPWVTKDREDLFINMLWLEKKMFSSSRNSFGVLTSTKGASIEIRSAFFHCQFEENRRDTKTKRRKRTDQGGINWSTL